MRAFWRGGFVVLLPVVLGAGAPAQPGPAAAPGHAVVLIAARDMAAGEKVTQEDLVLREVPSAWAPSSILTPESRQDILGMSLRFPVLKGDTLTGSMFEAASEAGFVERCARAVELPSSAPEQVARLRQLFLEGPPSGP